MPSSRQLEVSQALELLREARAVFSDFNESLTLTETARRLNVGTDWVRQHLVEFPHAWRLPAGERLVKGEGRNVGELRIPVADVKAFQERQQVRRAP